MIVMMVILTDCALPDSNDSETKSQTSTRIEQSQLPWLQEWFSAWELVSTKVFKLQNSRAPEMVFFDATYVYTTSNISAPTGQAFEGPRLFGEQLPWLKQPHNGTITLPDGKKIPVKIVAFAAPLKGSDRKAFFVMGAPDFWASKGEKSKELGLKNHLTGVFLHEFSHTRQFMVMNNEMESLDKKYSFEKVEGSGQVKIGDDMVQENFRHDSTYVRLFNQEVYTFYQAYFEKDNKKARALIRQGLFLLHKRQGSYLVKEKEVFKGLDDVWLTIEGMGQYAMVAWLIHPKGGNVPLEKAIEGARRGREWWSQDEGLVLALLVAKFTEPDWSGAVFDRKFNSLASMLEEQNRD